MKDRKWIMSSGLAFGDQEDMEMLHQYALQGWIFRECKGVFYILHKEAPQDLIFSYDCCKVGKDEEEEYYAVFEGMGWKPIKGKDKQIHFFVAKSGTVEVHTDREIQAQQYQSLTKVSLWTFLASFAILIVALQFKHLEGVAGTVQYVVALISAGLAGGSGMCYIGCSSRTKKKRLALNFSMKAIVGGLMLCSMTFIFARFFPWPIDGTMDGIRSLIYGLSSGGMIACSLHAIFKYPAYRDGVVK